MVYVEVICFQHNIDCSECFGSYLGIPSRPPIQKRRRNTKTAFNVFGFPHRYQPKLRRTIELKWLWRIQRQNNQQRNGTYFQLNQVILATRPQRLQNLPRKNVDDHQKLIRMALSFIGCFYGCMCYRLPRNVHPKPHRDPLLWRIDGLADDCTILHNPQIHRLYYHSNFLICHRDQIDKPVFKKEIKQGITVQSIFENYLNSIC